MPKRGFGGNKLHTNKQMILNELHAAPYCLEILSRKQRWALAKFSSGTAPIRVNTGYYQILDLSEQVCFHLASCIEGNTGHYQNLDLSEQVCFHLASCIEDKEHVLFVNPV